MSEVRQGRRKNKGKKSKKVRVRNENMQLSESFVMEMSPEEKKKARQMFDLYDYDKGGTIDISELTDLLDELDLGIELKDAKRFLAQVGVKITQGGETSINFDQFCAVYTLLIGNTSSAQRKTANRPGDRVGFEDVHLSETALRQAFDYYDADGSGKLDQEELGSILADLGFEDVYGDNFATIIDRTVKEFDVDNDGLIDFHEFTNYLNMIIEFMESTEATVKY